MAAAPTIQLWIDKSSIWIKKEENKLESHVFFLILQNMLKYFYWYNLDNTTHTMVGFLDDGTLRIRRKIVCAQIKNLNIIEKSKLWNTENQIDPQFLFTALQFTQIFDNLFDKLKVFLKGLN